MSDAVDSGDTAWVLVSASLVILMVPALALFYGGLVGPRAVVNTMILSFSSFATISIVWSLLGYTLAFSVNPSSALEPFIGGTHFGAFDSADRMRAETRMCVGG